MMAFLAFPFKSSPHLHFNTHNSFSSVRRTGNFWYYFVLNQHSNLNTLLFKPTKPGQAPLATLAFSYICYLKSTVTPLKLPLASSL